MNISINQSAVGRAATIGMFDGVHLGHRHLIDALKTVNRSTHSPIVVTFANHPAEVVNPARQIKLLTTSEEKSSLLANAGVTAVVMKFDADMQKLTSEQFMLRLRDEYGIDTLLLGFNNRFGSDTSSSFADYVATGNRVGVNIIKADELTIDAAAVNSSTIRTMLSEGRVEEANRMLGYDYKMTGRVVSGNRIGRTIGFPTANLIFESHKLIPAPGVYATTATLASGDTYPAMVNIGYRPTIDSAAHTLSVEAHLKGFEGDIYYKEITLTFHRRLRDEQQFPSLETLRHQLSLDLQNL